MKIVREMIFVMILILVFSNKKIFESWRVFFFLLEEKNGVLGYLVVEFFLTYVLGSGIISIFYSASLSLLIASLHSNYKLEGIKRNNWLGFRLMMKLHPKTISNGW